MERLPLDRSVLDSALERMDIADIAQSPDGIIHLLSSKNHYRFNLKWLEQND